MKNTKPKSTLQQLRRAKLQLEIDLLQMKIKKLRDHDWKSFDEKYLVRS